MIRILRFILRLLNYLFLRLRYIGRLKSNTFCYFSIRSIVIIYKNSQLHLKGKVTLSAFSELQSQGMLQLGHQVFINKFSRIIAHEKIEIGNNVLIAQFVTILDHDHRRVFKDGSMNFDGYVTKPVKIGNNVLIGDKVTILKGSEIGDNVVLAANSVVNGRIPSNSVFGNALPENLNTNLF